MMIQKGIFVIAKRSGGIRYVTKMVRGKDMFEDDGAISGQSPSPYCHTEYYVPLADVDTFAKFIKEKI